MNKLYLALSFALGAACGAAIMYKVVKDDADKKLQDEIQEIRYMYRKAEDKASDTIENTVKESREKIAEFAKDISRIAREARNKPSLVDYTKFSGGHSGKEDDIYGEERKDIAGDPCVISPDEFGEDDDYAILDLKYFTDGVLVDEMDEPIGEEEYPDLVGEDFMNHFGMYEEDSVFVRNDRKKCYYEILRDYRSYYKDVEPNKASPVRIREDEEDGEDTED